jgi:hypothetical protein
MIVLFITFYLNTVGTVFFTPAPRISTKYLPAGSFANDNLALPIVRVVSNLAAVLPRISTTLIFIFESAGALTLSVLPLTVINCLLANADTVITAAAIEDKNLFSLRVMQSPFAKVKKSPARIPAAVNVTHPKPRRGVIYLTMGAAHRVGVR